MDQGQGRLPEKYHFKTPRFRTYILNPLQVPFPTPYSSFGLPSHHFEKYTQRSRRTNLKNNKKIWSYSLLMTQFMVLVIVLGLPLTSFGINCWCSWSGEANWPWWWPSNNLACCHWQKCYRNLSNAGTRVCALLKYDRRHPSRWNVSGGTMV